MSVTLTRAGPAEILRAAQKDDFFCRKLRELLTEILLQVGGTRVLIKYRELLNATGNLMYFGATTLSGLQTLGEEYTGILQFDVLQSDIPQLRKRLLMILLSEFGQKLTSLLILKFEHHNLLRNEKSKIRPEARRDLLKFISYMKMIVPFLERLHRAVFYWTGYYCHISKHLTGIQYVLVRYWLKNRQSLYGFKLLSVVTTLQTLLVIITKSINFFNYNDQSLQAPTDNINKSVLSNKKCPLCLDERKNMIFKPTLK
ncbi:peroxisome biogenesis factor 10-like isoform X2 [Lycorma delicatula]|uniref:peroxisome biogenesis factor 10-like isoform X2 n=1 Tax=Lycorma delicatula TaxID=130591 RepID=UPI003F51733B